MLRALIILTTTLTMAIHTQVHPAGLKMALTLTLTLPLTRYTLLLMGLKVAYQLPIVCGSPPLSLRASVDDGRYNHYYDYYYRRPP